MKLSIEEDIFKLRNKMKTIILNNTGCVSYAEEKRNFLLLLRNLVPIYSYMRSLYINCKKYKHQEYY